MSETQTIIQTETQTVSQTINQTQEFKEEIKQDINANQELAIISNKPQKINVVAPSTIVNYAALRACFVEPGIFEKKEIKAPVVPQQQGQQQKAPTHYHVIQLLYNFDTDLGKKRIDDICIEGCEMYSNGGIRGGVTDNGDGTKKEQYSIMVAFDITNHEQMLFVECYNQLYMGAAHILFELRGQVAMPGFKEADPTSTGFKHPIHRPLDPLTNGIIEGRKPSTFLKLFKRKGYDGKVDRTLFCLPDGTEIPWECLNNVEMKFTPLINVKRIYIGQKALIQSEVVSAIVTHMIERNSIPKQLETMTKLTENDPELIDRVAAQFSRIMVARQDAIKAAESEPVTPTVQTQTQDNQPTFAGIIPTSQSQQVQQPQQPAYSQSSQQQYQPNTQQQFQPSTQQQFQPNTQQQFQQPIVQQQFQQPGAQQQFQQPNIQQSNIQQQASFPSVASAVQQQFQPQSQYQPSPQQYQPPTTDNVEQNRFSPSGLPNIPTPSVSDFTGGAPSRLGLPMNNMQRPGVFNPQLPGITNAPM